MIFKNKKKIAIFTTHPIQYQVPLFKKLKNKGIIPHVYFASKHGYKSKNQDSDFKKVFNWNINLLGGYKFFFSNNQKIKINSWFLDFNNLKNYLKKNKYDVVLIFGWSNIFYLKAFYLSYKYKLPIILRVETNNEAKISIIKKIIKNKILYLLFKYVNYFLYIGKLNKAFYVGLKVETKKLFSAPYFVDNRFFSNQKLKSKKKTFTCLFVGKLIKRKNPQVFLNLALLMKNYKNIKFQIVGDGDLKQYCKNFVKEYRLNNLHIRGFKNQTELKKYYKNADVLILPSKYETWGLVINEAMASSTAVITNKKCGASYDLIKNNKTGLIYDDENIYDLKNKVLKILLNKTLKKKIINNANKRIKLFTVDQTINSIVKILKNIYEKK